MFILFRAHGEQEHVQLEWEINWNKLSTAYYDSAAHERKKDLSHRGATATPCTYFKSFVSMSHIDLHFNGTR